MEMKLIDEKFVNLKYYLNLMTMYLKNSYGVKEQIQIILDIFKSIDKFYDEYVKKLSLTMDEQDIENSKDYLNKLGAIFNCSRNLTIPYSEEAISTQEIATAGMKYAELSDEEFLIFIKASIAKANFNGKMSELLELYGRANKYTNLHFTYLYSGVNEGSLICNIYFNNYKEFEKTGSKNIRNLFLNHMLTIESMGIQYQLVCQDVSGIGIFNESVFCANKQTNAGFGEKYIKVDLNRHLMIEKQYDSSKKLIADKFKLKYYDSNQELKPFSGDTNIIIQEVKEQPDKSYKYVKVDDAFTISHSSDEYIITKESGAKSLTSYRLIIYVGDDYKTDKFEKLVGVYIIVDKDRNFSLLSDTKLGVWAS